MASIINRSNYVVSVRSRDDLTRTFPYHRQPLLGHRAA